MPGIYIHIPFCKQACHYCNFHFSTSLKYKEDLLAALTKEITLRTDYLADKTIETIYFGGGTPSLLSQDEIQTIIDQLAQYYDIQAGAEITLEANPDDLLPKKIQAFRQTPINRFSIGIQSFFEEDLRWMNRAHNAQQANDCIQLAQDAGFHNLTIDLIYGSPTTSMDRWQENLQKSLELQIPHISAYCLTVEPDTALDYLVKTGKKEAIDEEQAALQFDCLVKTLKENGFLHYEISNFGKEDFLSRHNSNYWKGIPYIGLGPSAHSFDGKDRQWNVANNAHYIKAINEGELPSEVEILSQAERYNEYVMTSLRTMWGCDLKQIEMKFGKDLLSHLKREAKRYLENEILVEEGNILLLTDKGKFVADGVISELFFVG